MPQEARNVGLCSLRELILVFPVEKRVVVSCEKRLVRVHAAAVLANQRFGHEGGVDAVLHGYLFDDEAVGHRSVGHREGVHVAQVNLVLARGHLVVDVLNRNAHLMQSLHGVASQVRGGIPGGQVEVAAGIQDGGVLAVFEVEVLQLRTDVQSVARLGCHLQIAP